MAVIEGGPRSVATKSVPGPLLEGHAAVSSFGSQVLSAQSGAGPEGFLSTPLSSCASRQSVRGRTPRDRSGDRSPKSVGQSRSSPVDVSEAAGDMLELGHVGPVGSPSVRIGSWDLVMQGSVSACGEGSGPPAEGHVLDREDTNYGSENLVDGSVDGRAQLQEADGMRPCMQDLEWLPVSLSDTKWGQWPSRNANSSLPIHSVPG